MSDSLQKQVLYFFTVLLFCLVLLVSTLWLLFWLEYFPPSLATGEAVRLIKYDCWATQYESKSFYKSLPENLGLIWASGIKGADRIKEKFPFSQLGKHSGGSVSSKTKLEHHWNGGLSDACFIRSSITDGLSNLKDAIKRPILLGVNTISRLNVHSL